MAWLTSDPPVAQPDARHLLAMVLRLALGEPRREDAGANWRAAFEAASRELLAALAWHRSGPFIRRHADRLIVDAWRRAALAADVRGERQLTLLREVTRMLGAFGVEPIVLKGIPLGARLYGHPFIRCSADIDLFVPADQRSPAAATLEASGWQRTDGNAPWHESWSIMRAGAEHHLELHSILVSDHLAHIAPPEPCARRVRFGGTDVDALDGDFVAAYLAVHLATHQLPPLLWLMDFATLWASLSTLDRRRAEDAATSSGVSRYLDWARTRAADVTRAAAGDMAALAALGVRADGRRDVHSIWRHLALASTTADRARVLGAFIVPHRVRRDAWSIAMYTLARLRTRVRTLAGVTRTYDPGVAPYQRTPDESTARAPRALRVERDELVSFTGDVLAAGAGLLVRAPGGSMLPTIPRGGLVRIGPIPSAGIRIGDVVLALTADGEPVLHRVVSLTDDGIVMQGDAAIAADPTIPFRRLIGIATHVVDHGRDVSLGRRPRRSFAASALKMRRRIARMVRRVR
jgi:hypothetical protein